MDTKDIKRAIRELRAEMRASGIRKTSFMNGGLDSRTYAANAKLFSLSIELEKSQAALKA